MSSAYYKSLLKEKKTELKNYKNRKKDLEAIYKKYPNFDDNATDLTNLYKKIEKAIDAGLKINGASTAASDLWSVSEGGSWDGNLDDSRTYVGTEITRVDGKIMEIEREITRLEEQIRQAEAAEKAAAEKAAAEKAAAEKAAAEQNSK